LPLTCLFCATSIREMRRRLNQVRTVFPAETVTTVDCEPESRRAQADSFAHFERALNVLRADFVQRQALFRRP